MFTINFKSKANSQEAGRVKIEMIIYRPDYAHVPKVTTITGLAKNWDEKSQLFHSKSHETTEKNRALAELKDRYETVDKQWNKEGKAWSPRQLSHCFETEEKKRENVVDERSFKQLEINGFYGGR